MDDTHAQAVQDPLCYPRHAAESQPRGFVQQADVGEAARRFGRDGLEPSWVSRSGCAVGAIEARERDEAPDALDACTRRQLGISNSNSNSNGEHSRWTHLIRCEILCPRCCPPERLERGDGLEAG